MQTNCNICDIYGKPCGSCMEYAPVYKDRKADAVLVLILVAAVVWGIVGMLKSGECSLHKQIKDKQVEIRLTPQEQAIQDSLDRMAKAEFEPSLPEAYTTWIARVPDIDVLAMKGE